MKKLKYILTSLVMLFSLGQVMAESEKEAEEAFNPQKIIFEHLGDEYGWKVWNLEIPLPVIVAGQDGKWHLFSSTRLQDGATYEGFRIAEGGDYSGKVVEVDAQGNEYRPWDLSITKNVLAIIFADW